MRSILFMENAHMVAAGQNNIERAARETDAGLLSVGLMGWFRVRTSCITNGDHVGDHAGE